MQIDQLIEQLQHLQKSGVRKVLFSPIEDQLDDIAQIRITKTEQIFEDHFEDTTNAKTLTAVIELD